jgi:hypothetical protein
LAWLTLLPVMVCFPQISQLLDIVSFLKKAPRGKYYPYTKKRGKCKAPGREKRGAGRGGL